MSDFIPATPPNTPQRLAEFDRWMARENQAAVDKLQLTLRECADEARMFRESIEILTTLFPQTHPGNPTKGTSK